MTRPSKHYPAIRDSIRSNPRTNAEGKFCRDCRWCYGEHQNVCTHPDIAEYDIVSGENRVSPINARIGGKCGEEGNLWEPIPVIIRHFHGYIVIAILIAVIIGIALA